MADVQQHVSTNTAQLESFLRDLQEMEQGMKRKQSKNRQQWTAAQGPAPMSREAIQQEKRQESSLPPQSAIATAQANVKSQVAKRTFDRVQMSSEAIRQEKREGLSPAAGSTIATAKINSHAAKHTYDHYHDKWAKFDVDAALAAVDDEDEEVKAASAENVSSLETSEGVGVRMVGGVSEQRSTNAKGSGHRFRGSKHGPGLMDSVPGMEDSVPRTSGGFSASNAKREKSGSGSDDTAARKGRAPPFASSTTIGSRTGGSADAGPQMIGSSPGRSSADSVRLSSTVPLSHQKATRSAVLDRGPAAMLSRLADTADFDDSLPDATSEKDKGNEFFRQGRFSDAIDCYSRSIALRPTCIAYANRAMALLKLKRCKEAEEDCTEAIDLDDMYVKAYSRRGSARKELKKYVEAAEDFEYALHLEPENKELRQQLESVLPFCERESGVGKKTTQPSFLPEMSEKISRQPPSTHKISPVSVKDGSTGLSPAAVATSVSASRNMPNFSSLQPSTFGDAARGRVGSHAAVGSEAVSRVRITELPPEERTVSSSTRKVGVGGGEREAKSVSSALAEKDSVKKKVSERKAGGGGSEREAKSVSGVLGDKDSVKTNGRVCERIEGGGAGELETKSVSGTLADKDSVKRKGSEGEVGGGGGEQETKSFSGTLAHKVSVKQKGIKQTLEKARKTAEAAAIVQRQQAVTGAEGIAARAAAAARETVAKKAIAPKTAYLFENVWKTLADDRQAQARVLQMVDPSTLPKTFKDSLSANLLCDIVAVVDECFLPGDAARGIDILENLASVGRFDMMMMFLTSQQKAKLRHVWEESANSAAISTELQDRLQSIRTKYRV